MSLKNRILRIVDCFISPLNSWNTKRVLVNQRRVDELFVVGGGPSKKWLKDVSLNDRQGVALLNYTQIPKSINIDFLLLSDHYVFESKRLQFTKKFIRDCSPKVLILPTRAIFSLLGVYAIFKYQTIFVKYYGKPLWNTPDKLNFEPNLTDELFSYDTVAFEFGFPLAKSLNVTKLITVGVDLLYGTEEDEKPFRVRWRQNISDSLKNTYRPKSFVVYKIDKKSFGKFAVYRDDNA